jgi:hypothetical protein
VPPNLRAVARYNAGWFAVEAKLLMPSLELRPLSVAAQENFHAANIGVCRWGDRLIAMVRTVNWVIKDALSYEIRGGDAPSFVACHRALFISAPESRRVSRMVSSKSHTP